MISPVAHHFSTLARMVPSAPPTGNLPPYDGHGTGIKATQSLNPAASSRIAIELIAINDAIDASGLDG
jgi:hypothetical protein